MRSIPNLSRLWVVGGVAAASLAIGCASPVGEDTPLEVEFEDAPNWVVNGCDDFFGDQSSDSVCGVGAAEGSRNLALMRTTAIGRGRTEIARSLETKVLAMLKDYASTTTGGRDFGRSANDEQHIVDVSRQITKMSLSGTELTETWISHTGTYYVLVSLDVDKFSATVSEMEQLSERTRAAVVERAEEHFRELDEGA